MADSVYRVTEVIGVSSESWEAAARGHLAGSAPLDIGSVFAPAAAPFRVAPADRLRA